MSLPSILLVDDQETVRRSIPRGLNQFNWKTAPNGQIALDLINEQSFDLLITDSRMPLMDGAELLRQVSKLKSDQVINHHMPAIVLTGYDDDEVQSTCADQSGLFYVKKPWGTDLEIAIDRALEIGKLRRQLNQSSGDESVITTPTIVKEAKALLHDSNNNLCIGLGFLTMLEKLAVTEQDKDLFNIVSGVLKSQMSIVEDHCSKLSEFKLELKKVNLNKILRTDLSEQLQVIASDNNVQLAISLNQTISDVLATAGRIKRLILNLFTNSIEALSVRKNNSSRINIATAPRDLTAADLKSMFFSAAMDPGKFACLSIMDNGPGIPENNFGSLLSSPFTSKEKTESHGIGLISVRMIVQEIGGAIAIKTSNKIGTSFEIYIPSTCTSN